MSAKLDEAITSLEAAVKALKESVSKLELTYLANRPIKEDNVVDLPAFLRKQAE